MKRFAWLAIFAALILCASCISFTRPYKEVSYFQIAYDPPKVQGAPHKDVVVRVPSFDISPSFDRQKIMYSTGTLKLKSYDYNLWVTNVGEMLADLLVRDMIASGLYQAVVDIKSSINPDYELEATVEQIMEKDEGDAWYSVLRLRCIFFTYYRGKHVIYQRVYDQKVKTAGRTPADVVAAMGEAAKNTSTALQADMDSAITQYEAVKTQQKEQEKALGTKAG